MANKIGSPYVTFTFKSWKHLGYFDTPEKVLTFNKTVNAIVDKSIRLKLCK